MTSETRGPMIFIERSAQHRAFLIKFFGPDINLDASEAGVHSRSRPERGH